MLPCMKGDRVEILVDAGSGSIQRFEIEATRAGRRVETSTARGVVEVTEVTRGGTPVRSGRFMASRVGAVVDHPAAAALDARVEEVMSRRLSRPGLGERARGPRGRRGEDARQEPIRGSAGEGTMAGDAVLEADPGR
jgi:hypothetical protein